MSVQEKTPGRGRYTIRDIAQMAGVSRATVSLALNNSPKINSRTKELVLKIIREVGYHPSKTARNLVKRTTGSILVVLPRIEHVFSDVYFSECLSGIIEVTTQRQYHLMVDLATPEFKSEHRALTLFREGTIDGVLCAGNLTSDLYLVELAQAGCPVVLVNSSLPGVPGVLANNVEAARQATEHLFMLGHRRIGHIRAPQSVTTALDRTTGYLQALDQLGLRRDDELIAEGYFDESSGYAATRWLMSRSQPPTAIFTTNDVMAVGALKALTEMGMRVPDDVALFGGDDIHLARLLQPALSTMRQPMDAIGQRACEHLFRQIDGTASEGMPDQVELELVIRESCGNSRRSAAPVMRG